MRTLRRTGRGVVGLALAAVLTACSAAATSPPPRQVDAPAVPPARVTYAPPDDPVRMLFPVTGAESRWTQGLDAFGQQVARTVAAGCARQGGFALPGDAPPPAYIRFFDLPDLEFLARHGFSHSAEVPTTDTADVAGGSGQRIGRSHEITRCRAEGASAADTLRAHYAPLQSRWFAGLSALRDDPATARAMAALPGCLSRHGNGIRDENDFLRHVDSRLHSLPAAELSAADRALGRAYAACMRPVEAAREPARLRLRTRFLADHAAEVGEIRRVLVPAVRDAERRHGVRLSFPAPSPR